MDLDALLQAHGEDEPSGEDLEYDPTFTELEIAALHGEERQVGDEIVPGEDPDYKEVKAKALEVLERSHDLRAGIYLAEAELRLNGLPGFAAATSYLNRCLHEFWDTCHPQLDEDDDNDPTMRINAVRGLSDRKRIIRGLRRAPLTASRTFGSISLRDIAVAEGEATPSHDMETTVDAAAVAAAFQDTDEDTLRTIAKAAATALADIQAINAKFDRETPGQGPDLDALLKALKQINTRMGAATGEPVEIEAAADGDTSEAAAPRAAQASGGGAINTPVDVQNALDRIISYYERHEPSSPVPVLLKRAKKLVSADFLTIVKDMAPSGIESVYLIGGINAED